MTASSASFDRLILRVQDSRESEQKIITLMIGYRISAATVVVGSDYFS